MQVQQKLSILFYRQTKKKNKEGFMPLYCRVTIDGISGEISTSFKVKFDDWDIKTKTVLPTHPQYKDLNKKLRQMRTDLERHVDLVTAKHGLATPEKVFSSYQTPLNGEQIRRNKTELSLFSLALDELVKDFMKWDRKREKAENNLVYKELMAEKLLDEEKQELEKELEALSKQGKKIFEDKERTKTLCMAINEYELDFFQYVMADKKAPNTFKKKYGTKHRLQHFIRQQYKMEDMPLSMLDHKFIVDFVKKETTQYGSGQNTIWKYVQIIKEIINRAVGNGWLANNPFANYECSYVEPENKTWPTIEQMLFLMDFVFEEQDKELFDMRDIMVYQAFAGPSYAELYALRETHLIRENGKVWVKQKRRKSKSAENLPLLPICLDIIDRFKDHPKCQRTGKLLPVPTDQHYNRCIKIIGERTGITCLNNSHQLRYFFANELAYEACEDLHLTGLLMGQRNPNSIKTYVKPADRKINKTMGLVEEQLYGQGGPLAHKRENSAKIVRMKSFLGNSSEQQSD